jgi:hypothetical protein
VPDHLRIAEILQPEVDHGVVGVFRPRPAPIVAEGDVLGLTILAMTGVDRD